MSRPLQLLFEIKDSIFSRNASVIRAGYLAFLLVLLLSIRTWAEESTNQFLLLRLRLKDGEVTLINASVVSGRLKPQQDSVEVDPLVISLEQVVGEARWSTVIADPSIRRYEFEDPPQSGVLKAKTVQIDDVEFIVRTPLLAGVRNVGVYRNVNPGQQAKANLPASEKKLLSRIALPAAATK